MSSNKSKRTLGVGKPKLSSKNKLLKSRIPISDDEDGQATPQPSFLNRENQLSNLFSSQEGTSKYGKKKLTSLKYNFEEDGEFIYKRSQSPIQSRKKRKVNTPVSQLNEEMDLLVQDDLGSDSEDIFAFKKTRRNEKQRPKNPSSTNGNKLRSPLGDGYKSDDYIEHVSLEKLSLQDHDKLPAVNKRRQSYINRGKRVSSIGNGFVGEPHQDVPLSDYYKLLDTSLPPPDRMRQLLIWTMKKQLEKDEQASKLNEPANHTAMSIARVVKEELINDLIEKKISTSWYDRKKESPVSGKIITVPNPLNMSNLKNIELYSKKLKELKRQKAEWKEVFGQAVAGVEDMKIALPNDKFGLKEYLKTEKKGVIGLDAIDETIVPNVENDYKKLKELLKELPPMVDKLYFTAYQQNQATKLIKEVEETELEKNVSKYLQAYNNKSNPREHDPELELEQELQLESEGETSLPKPKTKSAPITSFDTKDLLRAICYVETKKKA